MKKSKCKVYAYCRVSTEDQDINIQKLSILEYARIHKINVSDFIMIEATDCQDEKYRSIDELMEDLNAGDTLIVSELSRLGRSVGQISCTVDDLIAKKIRFITIKEDIHINGKNNVQTIPLISCFSMLAEIERELISEHTKEGLEAERAKGKQLGMSKGSRGTSMLDGKEEFIKMELKYRVSVAAISRKLGCSQSNLINFIETRKLKEEMKKEAKTISIDKDKSYNRIHISNVDDK
ncbi:MAG: resolvase [Candidatus Scalindua sp. AMX11]|nr:MAG: resolvase [Candidatus Scalindua sp.]NOG83818.1 recombinase family protein [Planctomycetota bacterium]RZV82971.1 MAG: resolvase [Candidatus Scalindua sp. SCAELEC01]TDE64407.1 MAG: resolvase [Candidatus Scalindua sp. AMX11]